VSDPRASISPLPAPTALELQQSRRLKRLAAMSFQTIRASAERWRNAGLISGALTLAGTVIGGSDLVAGLTNSTRVVVVSIIGLAFLCGVVAVVLAIRASLGWPSYTAADTPAALQQWEVKETAIAVRCLQCSMWLSAATAVIVAVAVGVALTYGGRPQFVSLETAQLVICGQITSSADAEYVVNAGGVEVTVQIADVTRVSAASACE
jgi:hypothetical protein